MLAARLLSSCVCSLFAGAVAVAGPIPLVNPSFEEPVGPKAVGDATWSNIAGWTSTGPSADSGVERFTPAPQPELGDNIAFLQSGDGAIYQTSGYSIQSGDSFALSFYERDDFQATELTVRFYYDDGSRNVFNTQTVAFSGGVGRSGPLVQHTVGTTAPANAAGGLLGVEFENTSGNGGQWGWVDAVSLTQIPEPSSVAILLVSGAFLCSARKH